MPALIKLKRSDVFVIAVNGAVGGLQRRGHDRDGPRVPLGGVHQYV